MVAESILFSNISPTVLGVSYRTHASFAESFLIAVYPLIYVISCGPVLFLLLAYIVKLSQPVWLAIIYKKGRQLHCYHIWTKQELDLPSGPNFKRRTICEIRTRIFFLGFFGVFVFLNQTPKKEYPGFSSWRYKVGLAKHSFIRAEVTNANVHKMYIRECTSKPRKLTLGNVHALLTCSRTHTPRG